ncbi:coiled-coil domain-containing protein 113-like [Corticium candelabrum]|uniref:coiled-coil domain-containing protein 113-like n=1 Tax=Corticium candelabrum TaxID=121492 RepID=UPI002E2580C0|nr:coiled-coil domain-containing protein 113-like [Corticium candelabrum]
MATLGVGEDDWRHAETQDEEQYATMSIQELLDAWEKQRYENEVLERESDMFEKFLKRVEPKEAALTRRVSGSGAQGQDIRMAGRKRSRRGVIPDKMLRLTTEQKCDIATRELEELRDEIDRLQDECERVLDSYRASLEEADIRFGETKKAMYEFERDIVRGAVIQRIGKVSAERVSRYFEDKLRARDTLIEKLRLKNSTLKVQKKKLQMQLKQKEEMGEVLHEVDFNQLQIENKQYQEKIEERNQELLKLKLKAGNTQQVLNLYKKKLHTVTMESEHLKAEIKSRNDQLRKNAIEVEAVEQERQKADHLNRQLRQQLGDYRVPDVLDYVSERATLYEILKTVRSWERKVEIAQMALKTHKKEWNRLRKHSYQLNPWNALEGIPL